MKKNLLAGLVTFLCCSVSYGQMVKPIEMIPINKATIVYPVNGDSVSGSMKTAMYMNGKLMSFTIKPDNGGDNIKYKAVDVKTVKMKPSKLDKMASGMNSASGWVSLASVDWNSYLDMEWVYFETVVLKDGGRNWLMQRLNPGPQYDKLKIFLDPNASGAYEDNPSAYFLSKEGGASAYYVKRKEYLKKGSEIFNDCPEMIKLMETTSYNFDNIGAHTSFYNVLCK